MLLDLSKLPPNDLYDTCEAVLPTLPPIVPRDDLSMLSLHATCDKLALHLLPGDLEQPSLVPVMIEADGNCLPRCASLLAYGSEELHAEMRLRIIVELTLHKAYYLKPKNLSQGISEGSPQPNSKIYAQMSDTFVPCNELANLHAEKVYDEEVASLATMVTYLGIWQIFAIASILQVPVVSVYPERGITNNRRYLNRRILPRIPKHWKEAFIKWTSTRQDMVTEHWVPNHFLVLLP